MKPVSPSEGLLLFSRMALGTACWSCPGVVLPVVLAMASPTIVMDGLGVVLKLLFLGQLRSILALGLLTRLVVAVDAALDVVAVLQTRQRLTFVIVMTGATSVLVKLRIGFGVILGMLLVGELHNALLV